MLKGKYIGIIGCGNMGEAIIRGILARRIIPKSHMIISDAKKSRLVYIKHKYGLKYKGNEELAKKCDVLILAVKPQDLNSAMSSIFRPLSSKKLLISILAGKRIAKIKQLSKNRTQIVRVMPNMGALVGDAISAVSFGKGVKEENKKIVIKIFSSLGETVEVDEGHMDAITAVSGSGPAYFFYLVEALIESAVSLGIDREIAEKLAIRTAIGSAKLLAQRRQSPRVLRDKITSKGGTTEAALKIFDSKHLGRIVKEAVIAATKRSRELSEGK